MVKDFTINLTTRDDQQTFHSGETVSGLLHFTLKEPKSYKCIEIRLHGGAKVQWSEKQGVGKRSRTVTYTSEETYVHETRILWSSDQSPNGKIGPGTFDLPFEFVLSPYCLGTFQGSVGSISYTLHGLIKTGTFHRNHRIKVPIQVSRITDINIPKLLRPVHQMKKKQVGFLRFGSDVEFTVSLNRTGFCVGHDLPLTVSVVNGSSRRIKIRVSIRRYTHYYAHGHTNNDRRRILATVTTHNIAPHSQQTGMTIENLVVPMVEPSFTESRIIKMQYFLKVTAVIPWARNSSVEIPITLGNVPLNNTECS